MWDPSLEFGSAERLTGSPEIGGGGSSWRPWAGATGWGCQAEPLPSPTAQLGPLLPLPQRPSPENRGLESRVAFLPLPSALREGPAWPLAPATYGLLFCCTSLSQWRPGQAWAKAASRQPAPIPAAPAGCADHPGLGRTPGRSPGCHQVGQSIKNVPRCFSSRDCPWTVGALPGFLC